jgi:DNA helicase-2/ATP-dependent DNA helicase PcrA
MSWKENLDEGTPAYQLASSYAKTIRAVAGPGSGKSFAIKRRVARLLETGINPHEILAITFTRTAAQDLKREITSIGSAGAESVHSRTLHSHAMRILMQAEVLNTTGRTPRMVIEHEIAPALRDISSEKYGGIKNEKKLLDSYLAAWACMQSDDPGFVKDDIQESFESDLINWLKKYKGLLVGEVIPVAIDYLRNNPASPEIGKYKAILVDEYQDLNKSEQEFIKLIRGSAEIVIVGDDDQSIYGFKFAHPEGIREIDKLHGDFENIEFSECRRCPKKVTQMASALISKNKNRTLGDLIPHHNNNDGIVQIIQWNTNEDEITGLTNIIELEVKNGAIQPSDILILAPRRRIGYRLRDSLLAKGLPVKSHFRESAISKDTVKRAYSILNFLSNPDDSIALRYLIGCGSNDFRKSQCDKLNAIAAEKKLSLHDTLIEVLKGTIFETGIKSIVSDFRIVQHEMALLKKEILSKPEEALQNVFIKNDEDEIEFYELNELYKKSVTEVGTERLADPNEFDNWFRDVFKNIQEEIALPEVLEEIDHIRIMSLHASKGLSAKFVILCSMIDHLIPYMPDVSTEEEITHAIEEQRRLLYVAITRCKSSDAYPGRLIVSSFTSIFGLEAVKMGIQIPPSKIRSYIRVMSTRFLKDFGSTIPISILGNTLMKNS